MFGPVEKFHPLTGAKLVPLWVRPDGRAMWPIMGADEPSADDKQAALDKAAADKAIADKATADAAEAKKKEADKAGFPAETPVAEMTAEQRAAYWKFQNRKQEGRSNEWQSAVGSLTPAEVKKALADAEAARIAGLGEAEKAVEEAKKLGREEARREYGPKLAQSALEGAMGHKKAEERAVIIGALDLMAFIDDNGVVLQDKVKATVAALAPGGDNSSGDGDTVDTGAGRRKPNEKGFGSAGKAEAAKRAEKRAPKKTTTVV